MSVLARQGPDSLRHANAATFRGLLRQWRQRSPWLSTLALGHFALFGVLALLSIVDTVQILGIGRWIKPMKFALSLGLYLGALAWFAPAIGRPRVRRWAYAIIGGAMVLEIIVIVAQAARGRRSHFNVDTPLDGALFDVMGSAIMLNTIALLWVGVLALRGYRADATGYRLGIILGIVIAVGSSAIGGLMIASHGHTIGAADGGPGLPFVNWSTVGGDLRVAHFLGLHALQGLPLIGFLFGNRWVWVTGLAWVALTTITLMQAMAGRPLLSVGLS